MIAAIHMLARQIAAMHESNKFLSWFGHSRVVDSYGDPLLCFRGTSDTSMSFDPLAEFGSVETETHRLRMMSDTGHPDPDQVADRIAAHNEAGTLTLFQRVRAHPWGDYEVYDIYPDGACLVPVFLHIINPVVLTEDIAFDSDHAHAAILRGAGCSEKDIRRYLRRRHYRHHAQLCTMLLARGFDGVCYPNLSEGIGERSWIIVDPTQVWPLWGRRPIPVL